MRDIWAFDKGRSASSHARMLRDWLILKVSLNSFETKQNKNLGLRIVFELRPETSHYTDHEFTY